MLLFILFALVVCVNATPLDDDPFKECIGQCFDSDPPLDDDPFEECIDQCYDSHLKSLPKDRQSNERTISNSKYARIKKTWVLAL